MMHGQKNIKHGNVHAHMEVVVAGSTPWRRRQQFL